MTTTRWKTLSAATAAAATLLAGAAQAQVSSSPPRQAPAGVNTAKPAPAPAQAATPQAGAQQAGAQQATPDAKSIIENLHARNVQVSEFGKLAQERGQSANVKQMGQKLQADSDKLDQQLAPIAQEHGVTLADANKLKQDPALKQSLDSYRKLAGAEFDRAFSEATAQARIGEVDSLKAMRDRTPGQDWKLKKYLDDYENVMEDHRNFARNVRDDVKSRQGRAPPQK
jgi:putative membrane protein